MHNYFQVYYSGINLSAVIETFLVNVAVTILPIDMLRSWLGPDIDLDVSSFNYFPFWYGLMPYEVHLEYLLTFELHVDEALATNSRLIPRKALLVVQQNKPTPTSLCYELNYYFAN